MSGGLPAAFRGHGTLAPTGVDPSLRFAHPNAANATFTASNAVKVAFAASRHGILVVEAGTGGGLSVSRSSTIGSLARQDGGPSWWEPWRKVVSDDFATFLGLEGMAESEVRSVLHRIAGGSEVMVHQLTRLIELAELPNVTIHILPVACGVKAATFGHFNLLSLHRGREIVYVESLYGAEYVHDKAEVRGYNLMIASVRDDVLDEDESVALIKKVIKQI